MPPGSVTVMVADTGNVLVVDPPPGIGITVPPTPGPGAPPAGGDVGEAADGDVVVVLLLSTALKRGPNSPAIFSSKAVQLFISSCIPS